VAKTLNEQPKPAIETVVSEPEICDEVASLAYRFWQERGCPDGSDQEDWYRAENELKNRTVMVARAAS
jgi:hypothetical protein